MTKLLAICVIVFILFYDLNLLDIPVHTALLLPLSISNITYFDEYINSSLMIDSETKSKTLSLCNKNEILELLFELDENDNYLVSIEFIPDISAYSIDAPVLILSKPFLINSFSSSTTIQKFIDERLEFMVHYYHLDDSIIQETELGAAPVILLTCKKIYIE